MAFLTLHFVVENNHELHVEVFTKKNIYTHRKNAENQKNPLTKFKNIVLYY